MDIRRASESSESSRKKCPACYRQFNKMEHLIEHMKLSSHSVHEPKCGVCHKHCRSLESLREHLIGPLPKVDCARIFTSTGCTLCLAIFDNPTALRCHRAKCQQFGSQLGVRASMSRLDLSSNDAYVDLTRKRTSGSARVVALGCKMVGGGTDGSIDLCARVCLIDELEKIIFHSYVKPPIPVTNYRYEKTGIRSEHLREAIPLRKAQSTIEEFLCNGEAMWRMRSKGGRARILVGHGLDHTLSRLGVQYPRTLIRDTANYPPLRKTSKLSNSLQYLSQTYLGYEMEKGGVQDPYEECVASMRLYLKMRSQVHQKERLHLHHHTSGNLTMYRHKDLEKMSPSALLDISTADYYCWCLD